MPRRETTIDIGIDLGTTNSAIAVMQGTALRVIKNDDEEEYTPSAVWIERTGQLHVGREARAHLDDDPENAYAEFKLMMGYERPYRFSQTGRVMSPEQLSAEVLKAMCASARRDLGRDVAAAVVTIPAAFTANQSAATERAAALVGLTTCQLLHEPVGAALMYDFQRSGDKAMWLVYDFGGGTFDAAVIQVEHGQVSVVNHCGDNNLGGKLIDWKIVDRLFIPALAQQARLPDFRRGNPRWRSAIAKLKQDAERAKIALSRATSTVVSRDDLCRDERGQPVAFRFELTRAALDPLVAPFLDRTFDICRQALAEKHLRPEHIQKVLLVGGPTMMPMLRERLADPRAGLGIAADWRIDPLTVVAQGAALFASKQGLPQDPERRKGIIQGGRFLVSFPEWPFRGSFRDVDVLGEVIAPTNRSLDGHTLQFANGDAQPPWRSGLVPVAFDGAFFVSLHADPGKVNTFRIELRDPQGRTLASDTMPAELTYVVGSVVERTRLTHSLGIALRNNTVKWFLDKGAELPAEQRHSLETAHEVNPADDAQIMRIPIVEGASPRADRNRLVGALEITAGQLRRIIPARAEVQLTVEADPAGLVRMRAYIPILNARFEVALHWGGAEITPRLDAVRTNLQDQVTRLGQLRLVDDPAVRQAVAEVEARGLVRLASEEVEVAAQDADALPAASARVQELTIALDTAEALASWPQRVAQAEEMLAEAHRLLERLDAPMAAESRDTLERAERNINEAIQSHDALALENAVAQLRQVVIECLRRAGVLALMVFESIVRARPRYSNPSLAEELVSQGGEAITNHDMERLGAIVQQLLALIVDERQREVLASNPFASDVQERWV